MFGLIRRIFTREDRTAAATTAPVRTRAPRIVDGPLRVSLVEDNENLRVSLKLALELDGLTVAEAVDGDVGVEQILRDRPDVASSTCRCRG